VADLVDSQLAQDRIVASLAGIFGVVALLLAAAGLYGVLSHGIARRKGEIAIRMAIGARAVQVIWLFLSETGKLVILGLVIGAALTFGALRLIASQLYGLAPSDPVTLAFAALTLITVATAASYLPARRAARLDPMAALRQE
jgi:ABC-type antimicrobial peptide transport system permease subunit